ncbi:MAG: hypothetical protein RDU20_20930 [Desulfomonilaceae bacterium]|nr:hypothetical protein [Desulfomonilaceae bacterium]
MATRMEFTVIRHEKESQLCVHAVTGRAPLTKMCAHNYECGSCAYDQMLDDVVEMPCCVSARPGTATIAA